MSIPEVFAWEAFILWMDCCIAMLFCQNNNVFSKIFILSIWLEPVCKFTSLGRCCICENWIVDSLIKHSKCKLIWWNNVVDWIFSICVFNRNGYVKLTNSFINLFNLTQKALFMSDVPKHTKRVGYITTSVLLEDIGKCSQVNSASSCCCLPWII